jgi:hypothetical protein
VESLDVLAGSRSADQRMRPGHADPRRPRTDGTIVVGELTALRPEAVVLRIADGNTVTIPRFAIRSIEIAAANAATPAASTDARKSGRDGESESARMRSPTVAREVTAPSGTLLELSLNTPIGSDTSAIDDKVDAVLRAPLIVNGAQLLGAGTMAHGIVTEATPSTKAGRGRLSVRFNTIQLGQKSLPIQAAAVRWEASATPARERDRDESTSRSIWGRLVRKTKQGLRLGDDDRGRGASGASGGSAADVRFAPGAIVRIRLEQAARIAP